MRERKERRQPAVAPAAQASGTTVIVVLLLAVVVSAIVAACVSGAMWGLLNSDELSSASSEWAVEADPEWEPEIDPAETDFDPRTLSGSTAVEGTFLEGEVTTHDYALTFPNDAVFLRLDLHTNAGDVIWLSAAINRQNADFADWDQQLDDDGREKFVWFARKGSPDFSGGTMFVRLALQDGGDAKADYVLELNAVRRDVLAVLGPGDSHEGVVGHPQGGRATFEVRMPDGVDRVRVDLMDALRDLDLFVSTDGPSVDLGDAERAAEEPFATEFLIVARDELEDPDGGRFFLNVLDPHWNEWTSPYRILVSEGSAVPEELRTPLEFPAMDGALERAGQAIVLVRDIDGYGSAVVVSPKGLLLSAFHVVENESDANRDIRVAVVLDPARPPTEAFVARVLSYDADKDIALLRITGTVAGVPLPDDYRLPHLDVAWDDRLPLGAPLRSVGFPGTGGRNTRGTQTWGVGVVAGYERCEAFELMKTDASISNGYSGGALLDERLRVVANIQAALEDEGGGAHTGYALPSTELPDEWRRLIEADR